MAVWKTKWGWRADFVMDGERTIAKGFFRYKDEARQWIKDEEERLRNLRRSSSQENEQDTSLWFLAQKYLADCKINYDKKTFDEKRYCLDRLYQEVGDIDVVELTPMQVLDFLNHRAKSQSNHAANKDRKNIKAFYSWVQRMFNIMHDPTGPIKMKPHTRKQRRLIPIQDILKVMLVAKGHDRILIGSYWHTGARRSELFRWTWADDINFEERWVRLGTKKSISGVMVYEKLWMNDDLFKLLTWQWENRHPSSPYVFCHMNPKSTDYGLPFVARRKLLPKLCREAGVESFGYHDIRHTVAKYLNDLQKVGLKKVQQVLRHRRQTTTEIYVEGNYTDTQSTLSLLELDKVRDREENSLSISLSEIKKG